MSVVMFITTIPQHYLTQLTVYISYILNRALVEKYNYRPRRRGDNMFGSVRVCVRPSVCLWMLSCLNRFAFDLDFWHEGRP